MHSHLLENSGSSFEIYRWNLLSIYNSVITSFKILRNHSWQKCQEVCSMSHTTVTMKTACRRTILKNSLKESSFVLKFPMLHLYSNDQFSKFQQKSNKMFQKTYPWRYVTCKNKVTCKKKPKKSKPKIPEGKKKKRKKSCEIAWKESKHWTIWVWRKRMCFGIGRLQNSHNSNDNRTENWSLPYLSS